MADGTANRCIILDNSATGDGGGLYKVTANSCVVSGNSAAGNGGGIYSGIINNCTITGNSAIGEGNGTDYGTFKNCIVWHNTTDGNDMDGVTAYATCSPDVAPGSFGNITNAPLLFSSSHLAAGSPCIGAGNGAYATGTDFDGEPWSSPPSMGCSEYNPVPDGPLLLRLSVPARVALDASIPVHCTVVGAASLFPLDFGDGSTVSNQLQSTHTWSATGEYAVVLSAFNSDCPAGVAVTQQVQVVAANLYVSTTGDDAADGLSWATAKRTIQAAVDAAPYGGDVWVANGTYHPSAEIVAPHAMSIRGSSDPDLTRIDGQGSIRCFNLGGEDCLLFGLTIQNGHSSKNGGGIYCGNVTPVVSNCTFSANSGTSGGAMHSGRAVDCLFVGNTALYHGGALYHGSHNRCTFTDNSSGLEGGAVRSCTVNNSIFTGNAASYGGAVCYCTAKNCTAVGNTSSTYAGGAMNSALYNCIFCCNTNNGQVYDIYGNTAFNTCASDAPTGNGNTTNAPLFVGRANGDFHLLPSSPCIDAGNNAYLSADTDREGNPRIVNGTVDMGAYERQAGSGALDSDGDGMPDYWENQYFGNPTNAPATGNPDGDPFDNLAEYAADTSPTNSNDWFRVSSISNGPPATVWFDSSSNRLYTLLGCTNLVSNVWTVAEGPAVGAGEADSMEDTHTAPAKFYKLEVKLP